MVVKKTAAKPKKAPAKTKAKAKAPAKPRAKAEEKNGVKKPMKADGKCARIWAICDKLTKGKTIPTIQDVLAETNKTKDLVPGNVKPEYFNWRRFHGHAAVRTGKKKEAA